MTRTLVPRAEAPSVTRPTRSAGRGTPRTFAEHVERIEARILIARMFAETRATIRRESIARRETLRREKAALRLRWVRVRATRAEEAMIETLLVAVRCGALHAARPVEITAPMHVQERGSYGIE